MNSLPNYGPTVMLQCRGQCYPMCQYQKIYRSIKLSHVIRSGERALLSGWRIFDNLCDGGSLITFVMEAGGQEGLNRWVGATHLILNS